MKLYVLTSFNNYKYFANLLSIQDYGKSTGILKFIMEEMHASKITKLNKTSTCEAS